VSHHCTFEPAFNLPGSPLESRLAGDKSRQRPIFTALALAPTRGSKIRQPPRAVRARVRAASAGRCHSMPVNAKRTVEKRRDGAKNNCNWRLPCRIEQCRSCRPSHGALCRFRDRLVNETWYLSNKIYAPLCQREKKCDLFGLLRPICFYKHTTGSSPPPTAGLSLTALAHFRY
jgi:hypothetical protein